MRRVTGGKACGGRGLRVLIESGYGANTASNAQLCFGFSRPADTGMDAPSAISVVPAALSAPAPSSLDQFQMPSTDLLKLPEILQKSLPHQAAEVRPGPARTSPCELGPAGFQERHSRRR